jgi:CRISPR-associated protein Csb2
MPWEKKGPADRTLVFDTFVAVDRLEPLFIGWPDAEMSTDDQLLLARLLLNLSFLGRAEGWVCAELMDGTVDLSLGPADPSDPEPVPVLCPDPASFLDDEHYPTFDPAKLAKGRIPASRFLFDCPRWHLCLDTETIHEERWSSVPGAIWVNYTRPREVSAFASRQPRSPRRLTVARFLLDAPVLPLLTDAILLAESFRRGLMGQYQRQCHKQKYGHAGKPYREQFHSHVLSGKDASGSFLRQHRHAFYLPTVEGSNPRRVTHVTVVAEDGFGRNELAALNDLRSIRSEIETPEIRARLVGIGEIRDFRAPVLGNSRVWISATPFLATRHPKRRGRKRDPRSFFHSPDGPDEFVRRVVFEELERRGLNQDGVHIDSIQRLGPASVLRPLQFKLSRTKRGDDGTQRPRGAFRLTFPTPVAGPIALGHSCHFGLGLFLPESST